MEHAQETLGFWAGISAEEFSDRAWGEKSVAKVQRAQEKAKAKRGKKGKKPKPNTLMELRAQQSVLEDRDLNEMDYSRVEEFVAHHMLKANKELNREVGAKCNELRTKLSSNVMSAEVQITSLVKTRLDLLQHRMNDSNELLVTVHDLAQMAKAATLRKEERRRKRKEEKLLVAKQEAELQELIMAEAEAGETEASAENEAGI